MGWTKALSVVFLSSLAMSAMASLPEVIPVRIDKSYVPVGFDDNDKVQVTIAGVFPNNCFKVGPYRTHVDAARKRIYVEQSAYRYQGVCLQVLVPFTQTIELGIVREGTYSVRDALTGKKLGDLPVNRAKTDSPDDFLYAPISDAYVALDGAGYRMTLKGTFTDRCMRLKEVKVSYYKDVVVVQPIAEMIGTPHNCGHELVRFQHEEILQDGLKGTYLLHVRSMEGQAINKLVEFN